MTGYIYFKNHLIPRRFLHWISIFDWRTWGSTIKNLIVKGAPCKLIFAPIKDKIQFYDTTSQIRQFKIAW